jgi:hypothetical protein
LVLGIVDADGDENGGGQVGDDVLAHAVEEFPALAAAEARDDDAPGPRRGGVEEALQLGAPAVREGTGFRYGIAKADKIVHG